MCYFWALVLWTTALILGLALKLKRKVRTSLSSARDNAPLPQGKEQWNRENVQSNDPFGGNGSLKGSDGVKTAKLCVKQEQIGECVART
jgi:hypothetical protein